MEHTKTDVQLQLSNARDEIIECKEAINEALDLLAEVGPGGLAKAEFENWFRRVAIFANRHGR